MGRKPPITPKITEHTSFFRTSRTISKPKAPPLLFPWPSVLVSVFPSVPSLLLHCPCQVLVHAVFSKPNRVAKQKSQDPRIPRKNRVKEHPSLMQARQFLKNLIHNPRSNLNPNTILRPLHFQITFLFQNIFCHSHANAFTFQLARSSVSTYHPPTTYPHLPHPLSPVAVSRANATGAIFGCRFTRCTRRARRPARAPKAGWQGVPGSSIDWKFTPENRPSQKK